jgi:adenylate cyclase
LSLERVQKRLAAILAADVVGFSRLVGIDELDTLARLKTLRTTLIDPALAAHGGRLVKTTGDGLLVEFASAVEALNCAIELQQDMAERNGDTAEERRIVYRMGVHIGEVIVDGDDILGDGVNITARLEAAADPVGICLSARVVDHVRGRIDCAFDDRGEHRLKNIAEPLRLYRVRGLGTPGRMAAGAGSFAGSSRPSIAILPFDNLSGDPDQAYFADGMVEEIAAGVSAIRWLTVIGRNSSFTFKDASDTPVQIARALGARYLLKGSVRKAGDRVRITTHPLDGGDGAQIWTERFEGSLADIFQLQDDIAEGVVGAIEPSLRRAEIARIKRNRQDDLDAYDLYLRALSHMYEVTPEGRIAALELAGKALEIDPDYAEAHGVAAWCYFARSLWETGFISDEYRQGALRHARAVLALQTEDASTLADAAISLALVKRDLEAALALIDRALEINPSSVQAHGHGAVINAWAGNRDRAIELGERSLKLSPFDPLSVMPLAGMAGARLANGEFEAAVELARKGLQIYPTHMPSHLILIAGLIRLGRQEAAAAAAANFIEISPKFRVSHVGAFILKNFRGDLEAAGLPG